jgi:uncharacterized protein YdaU (DUF1376 family)
MPFYAGDYLADTQHLDTAQHGAYLLLIMHYWSNEGLPDDDKLLAKITKLPVHSWRQMRPKIEVFFHDGWHHKRIDEEIAKYDSKIARLKVSGSIGGNRAASARAKSKHMLPKNPSQAIAREDIARLQHPEPDLTTTTTSVAARARARVPKEKRLSNGEVGAGSTAELNAVMAAKRWIP